MQHQTKDKTLGRIDYIVQGNTPGVLRLIRNYGYAAPRDEKHLTTVVKEIIRENGRPAIRKLLRYHPDRKLLLKLAGEKEDNYCNFCGNTHEDSYCGCGHSNYDGTAPSNSLTDKLRNMSLADMEKFYSEMLVKANANPTDKTLASDLQTVWATLRGKLTESVQRTASTENVSQPEPSIKGVDTRELLLIFGLAVTAGVLVGVSIKAGSNG